MDKNNYSKIIIIYFKAIIVIINLDILFESSHFYKTVNKINVTKHNKIYQEKIFFNISLINYSFNFQFNMAKVEYNIIFADENNNIIKPSHLTFFHRLHIFCNTIENNSNVTVKYIANILENKYYNCIEYLNVKQNTKFGIIIYQINKYTEYNTEILFNSDIIDYNNIFSTNLNEFSPLIQINEYKKLLIDQNKNNSFLLKKLFLLPPKFSIKYDLNIKLNIWYYKNIYNNFFCLCKTSNYQCLYRNISKKCKYNLYLNIIDKTRNLYKKTDYLFADFSSDNTAPSEGYLVFNELIKNNISAHYMTKREDIYQKFVNFKKNIEFPILFDSFFIHGDFLEKYLDLFLRLKAVIVGAKVYSINNLFLYIEYITYICLGHGISYFKDFLYKDYYSQNIYNKIILPPSQIIISNAKKYGWKEENIIEIGLPRWDILCSNEKQQIFFPLNNSIKNNSIFAMFTWRQININQKISKYYLKNIFRLINNPKLNKILSKNNIIFYYSLHHMIEKYQKIFKLNKIVSYINQEDIMECLSKSNIIISDFSSIIFDAIVMEKPYIIFI